jgi:hypothetical protein
VLSIVEGIRILPGDDVFDLWANTEENILSKIFLLAVFFIFS